MYKLFYSWQSDKPVRRKAIRKVLRDAVKGTEWEVIESTTNIKGAVDITRAIDDRIRESDYFIADMCIVGKKFRKYFINSNVAFEAGTALARKGEENILLIVAPGDVDKARYPFDVRNRAVMELDPASDESVKRLKKLIHDKTKAIAANRVAAYHGPAFRCSDIAIGLEKGYPELQFTFINNEDKDYNVEFIKFGDLMSQKEFVVKRKSDEKSSSLKLSHYPLVDNEIKFKYMIKSVPRDETYVMHQVIKLQQYKDGLFYYKSLSANVRVETIDRD